MRYAMSLFGPKRSFLALSGQAIALGDVRFWGQSEHHHLTTPHRRHGRWL